MKKEIHTIAAKEHLSIAIEYDEKMKTQKDANGKTALMTVASQNYFYAAINSVEAVLAGKDIHSFHHENRMRNMAENTELFDDELYSLYNDVERDIRNKVAYRGYNGELYKNIKDLAEKAIKAI